MGKRKHDPAKRRAEVKTNRERIEKLLQPGSGRLDRIARFQRESGMSGYSAHLTTKQVSDQL